MGLLCTLGEGMQWRAQSIVSAMEKHRTEGEGGGPVPRSRPHLCPMTSLSSLCLSQELCWGIGGGGASLPNPQTPDMPGWELSRGFAPLAVFTAPLPLAKSGPGWPILFISILPPKSLPP